MTRAWRIVLWIAAALFAAGLVLAGAGWLSGASTGRIVNEVFGSRAGLQTELDAVLAQLRSLLDGLRNLF